MATNPPIQIGELLDVPAPGSGVKSQFHQEITNRIHHRFATPAARTAAFTAPLQVAAKGQASYLAAGDATEGIEYFNGAAWRKPWNMPWGEVAYAEASATQSGIVAATDITGATVTFTPVPNRKYLVMGEVALLQVGAGSATSVYLADGASTHLQQAPIALAAGDYGTYTIKRRFSYATATPVTFKLRAATGAGSVTVYQSASVPTIVIVLDVGPAIGAPA